MIKPPLSEPEVSPLREHVGTPADESLPVSANPPLPHLTGATNPTRPRKRPRWWVLPLNGVAFLIGSLFLLWAGGLLVGGMTESSTPGALSRSDIVLMIGFALLGVGSIVWLVLGFVRRQENRGE